MDISLASKPAALSDRDFLERLHNRVEPILQRISDQINNYSIEEIRTIARDALDHHRDLALQQRELNCTEDEIVESVAGALAYHEVIAPAVPAIKSILKASPKEDAQIEAYLEKVPHMSVYLKLRTSLTHRYRLEPLEEQMGKRLEPYVKEALAPFFREVNSAPKAATETSFSFANLLHRFCPLFS